jgi:hypothetical protein
MVMLESQQMVFLVLEKGKEAEVRKTVEGGMHP